MRDGNDDEAGYFPTITMTGNKRCAEIRLWLEWTRGKGTNSKEAEEKKRG